MAGPLVSQGGAQRTVALLAATALSPGAKELLRADGVGYFDSGGSLYVPDPGAYVYVDRPPSKAQAAAMRSLFAGRRAQAISTRSRRSRRNFLATTASPQRGSGTPTC